MFILTGKGRTSRSLRGDASVDESNRPKVVIIDNDVCFTTNNAAFKRRRWRCEAVV